MTARQLQEKKMNVIEQLILLNDKKAIDKIETIINESLHRPELKKFTHQELLERALEANKDIEAGRGLTQEEVEKLSNEW